jgi:hypothetical protein
MGSTGDMKMSCNHSYNIIPKGISKLRRNYKGLFVEKPNHLIIPL